jgi:hypothetical protein
MAEQLFVRHLGVIERIIAIIVGRHHLNQAVTQLCQRILRPRPSKNSTA